MNAIFARFVRIRNGGSRKLYAAPKSVVEEPCSWCGGSGRKWEMRCMNCDGIGRVWREGGR